MSESDGPTSGTDRPSEVSGDRPVRRRTGLGQRRNVIIGIALVAGFALGLGLVLLPGRDSGGSSTSVPEVEVTTAPATPLELDDTSIGSIAELTGLVFPASTADFQTAVTETFTQLDVTFTIPSADEAEFIEGSDLGAPVAGERTILHSSPMWKLNADGEGEIRGVADQTERVNRSVELVPEGDGLTRVRIVITAA